jgi:probable HAF family extracellular repeat protein
MQKIALSILAALTGTVWAQNPAFTLIDYPNAASTQVWAINARGEMAGMYVSADKASHGFVLRNGQFTSIDYPGATLTLCNGIGANGDIYGEYATATTAPHHGFMLSEGQYTTIDFPGATATYAVGGGSNGEILGGYNFADNISHGFILKNGQFTSVDCPEATQTVAGGAGVNGELLGGAPVNGLPRALLYHHGQFTLWDYPGANFTNALARNAVGDIVGRWRDSSNAVHGYVLSNGKFSSFDCPGATFTGAAGITADGDVVGRCQINGVYHGFYMARAQHVRYNITDLGTLGGTNATAYAINESGMVTGVANLANGNQHPVLWTNGTITDLGTLGGPNGGAGSSTGGGLVAVAAETATRDPLGEDFCGFGTHLTCLPAFWSNGKLTQLPTLGGANAIGFNLNNRGQMVGAAETATHDPNCAAPQVVNMLPAFWRPGGAIQALPLPPGDTSGFAVDLNDKGEAVGGTGVCSDIIVGLTGLLSSSRAVLWRNGAAIDLGALYGSAVNAAISINNRTEIVGGAAAPNGTDTLGFLWTPDGGLTGLGPLDGDSSALPSSINDAGQITGASCDNDGNCRGVMWSKGATIDLNTLISEDSPILIVFPTWINNVGEIVGIAVDKQTGDTRAFLASPVETGLASAAMARPLASEHLRQMLRARIHPRVLRSRAGH